MLLQIKNLIVLLFVFNTTLFAQTDSTMNKRNWYHPTGVTTEYAGGFGMVSLGGLFSPFRKTEVAITGGYTPISYGNLWTINILYSYSPVHIRLNKQLELFPINAGVFVSYNAGSNIYIKWPDKYVGGYYWWNSSLRYGPFAEADLKYTFRNKNQNLTFFFQCLTNDLYLYTYIPNTRFFSFSDILVLGMGIKFCFKLFFAFKCNIIYI